MSSTCSPAPGWRSVCWTRTTVDDRFWSEVRERIRTVALPEQEAQLRRPGRQVDTLTPGWRPPPSGALWVEESDVAKWIEAASHVLARRPDPVLEAGVDEVIGLLAGAQQPDGYLNVRFTTVAPGQRFTDLRDAHELYGAGHLIEAGVAHAQATGKTTLLEVVRRYADLIVTEFGPGGAHQDGYCGHEEIELALVRLAELTGERRYLDQSRRFLDLRGTRPFYFEAEAARRGTPGLHEGLFPDRAGQAQRVREYHQAHAPVREQREAVGHAVRAMYLYAAMSDVATADGDEAMRTAVLGLWDDVTTRKMYVTGGLGSDPSIEGFGPAWHLPEVGGYAETCASIGLVQWAGRMARQEGDARFVDVLELALYNGVLSGMSADGRSYFYANPMSSDGSAARQEWFDVACCPPNLIRLLTSVERYAYGESDSEAVVQLFVSGTTRFALAAGELALQQVSDYLDEGTTRLVVTQAPEAEVALLVRRPGWAERAELLLNGETVDAPVERGYLVLRRCWRAGDQVQLRLSMTPTRLRADPRVADARGRVALRRGPIVYCLEGVDHEVPLERLALPADAELQTVPDPRTGVPALEAIAVVTDPGGASSTTVGTDPDGASSSRAGGDTGRGLTTVRAVPYFSWANRGPSTMTVWIPELP